MKKYQFIVIDDDNMDRLATNYYLKNYPFLEHKASFSTPQDGLRYLDYNTVDIIFLDIDMPEMNGIELQYKIKHKEICTVFITSHPEFALESFELEAFDYIIKPLKKLRFEACVKRLKEYLDVKFKAKLFENSCVDESILVKTGYESISIKPNEIAYLEALKDYTKVILYDSSSIVAHGNLGTTLRDDKFKHFIRIHRSYAIQKQYIKIVRTNEVVLTNGTVLPIGHYYREDLMNILS